ncbi:hypothetical protein PG997_001656 [Apiospora hydei]|uniref:Uncharacterized protein n=1 Tax=Apiospora hydei TaxID=1337664 RepID=A0ABR1XE44_9PEZI
MILRPLYHQGGLNHLADVTKLLQTVPKKMDRVGYSRSSKLTGTIFMNSRRDRSALTGTMKSNGMPWGLANVEMCARAFPQDNIRNGYCQALEDVEASIGVRCVNHLPMRSVGASFAWLHKAQARVPCQAEEQKQAPDEVLAKEASMISRPNRDSSKPLA